MLVAGLLAALVNVVLLTGGDATSPVLVAARDIAAGERLGAGDFRTADLVIDAGLLAHLLTPGAFDGPGTFDGWLALTPVTRGEVVRTADLQRPASTNGVRAMSLPLVSAHAAGGDIAVGDLVDVIETTPEGASYIVTGARVTAVQRGGSGGLAASSGGSLTIEVDASQALCLAAALRGGGIDVVLSTGAPPVPATGCAA